MTDFFIIAPVILGTILGLSVLYCCYRGLSSGHTLYTCTYSKSELVNVLKRNPRLGRPVQRVDLGLYRVTGHKFLYPDQIPMDPNYFDGLMSLQQFAHVMIMINTAIIEASIGKCKVPCTCDGGYMTESARSERYAAASIACRQATAYLRQNNIQAVVYQTTDHELRRYLNGSYQGTDWDTSIYISFRPEDVRDVEIGVFNILAPLGNSLIYNTVAPIPVAAVVANQPNLVVDKPSASEFAHIQDPRIVKIATDMRRFYMRFDPARTTAQIEPVATWAAEAGVEALNEKLREKYGHDLTTLAQTTPATSDKKSEFAYINNPRVAKIATEMRQFYVRFDPARTTAQIEPVATWAAEAGVEALNEKLREKYGHDLNSMKEEPPV